MSVLAQILSRSRLALVRLVTSWAKVLFGQVGDQVSQVKDQVGQGQGQELDNFEESEYTHIVQYRIESRETLSISVLH